MKSRTGTQNAGTCALPAGSCGGTIAIGNLAVGKLAKYFVSSFVVIYQARRHVISLVAVWLQEGKLLLGGKER